jgi:hypothetical protein
MDRGSFWLWLLCTFQDERLVGIDPLPNDMGWFGLCSSISLQKVFCCAVEQRGNKCEMFPIHNVCSLRALWTGSYSVVVSMSILILTCVPKII